MRLKHPARTFWVIALVVLACDQLLKFAVRASLAPGETRPLLPGILDLTHVRNAGAAFGIFPGRQPVFVITSVMVVFVVWAYWRRSHPTVWPVVVAGALIVSGAVGNLIDRVWLGRVTDFVATAFIDFPVFNVADSAIVIGVAILIVWLWFGPDPLSHDTHDQDATTAGGAE